VIHYSFLSNFFTYRYFDPIFCTQEEYWYIPWLFA